MADLSEQEWGEVRRRQADPIKWPGSPLLLRALAQREAERDTLEKVNQGYRDWIERCAETLGGLSPQEYAEQAEAALANAGDKQIRLLEELATERATSERLREALEKFWKVVERWRLRKGHGIAHDCDLCDGLREAGIWLAAQPDAGVAERLAGLVCELDHSFGRNGGTCCLEVLRESQSPPAPDAGQEEGR